MFSANDKGEPTTVSEALALGLYRNFFIMTAFLSIASIAGVDHDAVAETIRSTVKPLISANGHASHQTQVAPVQAPAP